MSHFGLATVFSLTIALVAAFAPYASAQGRYDIGASDAEIKIGNLTPYSGPASAYGVFGKVQAAYFRMLNANGGIDGRKINFVTYDDAYSPPKAVEQVRKLVEGDEVLLVFSPLGTPSNAAIQRYLNGKKVPQLFVASGAVRWNDPKNFPWTMGWAPSYQSEARVFGKYLLAEHPEAKVGVLYQNDDYGKDYLKGLKDGLGAKSTQMVVLEESYETSEPVIDTHIAKLRAANTSAVLLFATPKFAAQAIKRIYELGWKPLIVVNSVAASVGSVIKPVGFEAAQGLLSASYAKDPTDPQWRDDPGIKEFEQFLAREYPDADRSDLNVILGYSLAQTMAHVLASCGDDLTRANVMKQAANIRDLKLGGLLPGIVLNTTPADFAPIKQLQLMKFQGERWTLIGGVLTDDLGR